ncbi:MAG: mannose-1-phosphate guanylyltransferase [Bacteroidota bacterium]
MDKNVYCVIMAGGIGSRFWPLSRTKTPKQFLDILGTGKTLIQKTFERLEQVCLKENIFIVTNSDYKNLVLKQIPGISQNRILLEPLRRNTAPCVDYANFRILQENPDASIIVAPSDHLILKEEEFIKVLKKGLEFISKNDALLTLGIKPSRPDTGYGYIQINSEVKESIQKNISKVKTFTEKPNIELAKFFVESGEFYWNSGIFMWKLKTIMSEFAIHLPDIHSFFAEGTKLYNTSKEKSFIAKTYSKCKNISIDYGIMEKSDNVYVLCSDFGWSDLGTWGSLFDHSDKDENNNTVRGNNVLLYDAKNCIVNMPLEKLVVIQGLEDYIVVESENVLLICKKEEEQQIRQFVNDIKIKTGEKNI